MELTRISNIFFIILLSFITFTYFAKNIKDPDFFWHLKTGEYIFENRKIPDRDPFSFTSPDPPTERVKFILKQYWISQLIFYLLYKHFGFVGIIILRALIFTIIILMLFNMIIKRRLNYYLSILFIFLVLIIAFDFKGDRPQLFSFLFATILIYILEYYREKLFYISLIPIIMIIWANMHGGYILGDLIIFIYLVSQWIKKIFDLKRDILDDRSIYTYSILLLLAIIFSFINPNTFKVIPAIFELERSIFRREVTEYLSPIEQIKYLHNYWLPFWIFLSLIIIVVIINIKRIDMEHIFIISILSIISFTAIRYIIFLVIILTPIIAKYISLTINRFSFFKRRYIFLDIAIIALLTVILFKSFTKVSFGISRYSYPIEASNFLIKNRIKGNMFNLYNWGGYLIWALYPEYKVSIDPRGLNEKVHKDFEDILSGTGRNDLKPKWKRLLDSYNINFIFINSCDLFSGYFYPLIPIIMNDENWVLIYIDNSSLIFVRNSDKNKDLIRKLYIPKYRIYDEIIIEAMRGISSKPHVSGYYTSLGYALIGKDNYKHAKLMLIKAIKLNPDDNIAKGMLNVIMGLGY